MLEQYNNEEEGELCNKEDADMNELKILICSQCDFEAFDRKPLDEHIQTTHMKVALVFTCVNNHVKIVHQKVKNFECNQCTYACGSKGNLDGHVKMVHGKIKDF